MPIPPNRTTSNTPAEHVSDHNLLHAFYNAYENLPPSSFASSSHTHDAAVLITGQVAAARLGAGTMAATSVLRGTAFSTTLAAWGALGLAELGNYQDNAGKATGYVLTLSADLTHYSWQPVAGGGGTGTTVLPGQGITTTPTATTLTIEADQVELYENYAPGVHAGDWTKPAGMVFALIELWAAGGGGGAGGRSTGAVNVQAGSGGGGGAYLRLIVPAALLPGAADVTVGTGGPGGVGANANGVGAAGTAGTATTFWNASGLSVQGGSGGVGGSIDGSAGTVAAGGTFGMYGGGKGAAAAANGGAGVLPLDIIASHMIATSNDTMAIAPGGGPSGGGINSAGTQTNGLLGTYYSWVQANNGGTAGAFGGTRNGGNATVHALGFGSSGGSGASSDNATGAAGNGGTSERGFGGPGGGGARGGKAGDGGRGGHGGVRITAYR